MGKRDVLPYTLTCYYAAVRHSDGHDWIQTSSISGSADMARSNAEESDLKNGPGWAKANPIVGVARVSEYTYKHVCLDCGKPCAVGVVGFVRHHPWGDETFHRPASLCCKADYQTREAWDGHERRMKDIDQGVTP